MFLKSNKNGMQRFSPDDEYCMLSFFNVVTPIWSEVTIVLLLADSVTISYDMRLVIIGLMVIVNIVISRIIMWRLKREGYLTKVIDEFKDDDITNTKFNNFFFCLMLLAIYAVIPVAPIVLYYNM